MIEPLRLPHARKLYILMLFGLLMHPLFANAAWLTSYDEAVSAARKNSKPILIDCVADWCVWCHRLEQEVYSQPEFQTMLEGFVPLRVNIEDQAQGAKLAELYGVNSLPTLLVIESEGNLLNRVGGFLPAKELINDITTTQSLLLDENLNPKNLVSSKKLAEEYLLRDMDSESESRFQKIIASPDATDQQKDSVYFPLALAQYYQQKLEPSLSTLNRYKQVFPQGPSLEDVYLLESQIYLELNRKDQARSSLEEFLTKFPENRSADRAKSVLKFLR